MSENNYQKSLLDLFPTVVNSFMNCKKNNSELAYLSLTSKPEAAIRDKFAYFLQQKSENNSQIFAKEFKRYDLVVLDLDKPPVNDLPHINHILEFKAGSAASFRKSNRTNSWLKKGDEFIDRVISDIRNRNNKNIKPGIGIDKITGVFIGVEALNRIPDRYHSFIKYSKRYNRIFDNDAYSNIDLGANLKKRFCEYRSAKNKDKTPFSKVKHKSEKAGSFLGIEVKLHLVVVSGNEL